MFLTTITDYYNVEYIFNQRGHPRVVFNDYLYNRNRTKYWRCLRASRYNCKATLIITNGRIQKAIGFHNHERECEEILRVKRHKQAIFNTTKEPKLLKKPEHSSVTDPTCMDSSMYSNPSRPWYVNSTPDVPAVGLGGHAMSFESILRNDHHAPWPGVPGSAGEMLQQQNIGPSTLESLLRNDTCPNTTNNVNSMQMVASTNHESMQRHGYTTDTFPPISTGVGPHHQPQHQHEPNITYNVENVEIKSEPLGEADC